MTGEDFLKQLQAEAGPDGYHRTTAKVQGINAWVDDHSSVARALRELDVRNS